MVKTIKRKKENTSFPLLLPERRKREGTEDEDEDEEEEEERGG